MALGFPMSLLFLNPHRPQTRTGTVSSAFWLPAAAHSVTARGASLEHLPHRHEAPKMTRPKCSGFSGARIATGKFIPEAAILKFLRPNFERFYSPGPRSAPAVCMIPGHASHPFDCAFCLAVGYMTPTESNAPTKPETFSHHRQHRQRAPETSRPKSFPRV